MRLGLLGAVALAGGSVQAGGGPENVAVVVNADSWASLAIANEYISLRNVPDNNVVYLTGLPSNLSVDVNQFRELILGPVLKTLEQRGLAGQIDCVAYSSDVPYAVHVQPDLGKVQQHKVLTPVAAVNGLTYLYGLVLAKNPAYLALDVNRYFRQRRGAAEEPARTPKKLLQQNEPTQFETQPPRAFRSSIGWLPNGEPAPTATEGMRYLLSTMLAMTSGRGNSVREAIAGLRRSAAADGTSPAGTVYYLQNSDIRSTTRQWGFASAAKQLTALRVRSEVLPGVLPPKKADVAGAMIGTANFSWPSSGSTILPGAICEHLTSCGGIMQEDGSQTPLSEFLRHGAAAASGTVTEPFAIQNKFPTPFLHVYYASGCTLAEAFYQAVRGPYQLLIVGDPLCRPWAAIPPLTIEVVPGGMTVKGQFAIRPKLTGAARIGRFELFLDGRRAAVTPPTAELRLPSTDLSDGHHELRLVAVADDPLETQTHAVVPLVVNNRGLSMHVDPVPKTVPLDQSLTFGARMAAAKRIVFVQNGRELGTIAGPEGSITVPAAKLGLGKIRVQAIALLRDPVPASPAQATAPEPKPAPPPGPGGPLSDAAQPVAPPPEPGWPLSDAAKPAAAPPKPSAAAAGPAPADACLGMPIAVEILPPKPLAAMTAVPKDLVPGLLLTPAGAAGVVVERTKDRDWLSKAVPAGKEFVLEGFFAVPAEDVYQFQVRTAMDVEIRIDDQRLTQPAGAASALKYLPASLAAGTHKLTVQGRAVDKATLEIGFGGAGTPRIGADHFRHPKPASAKYP